MFTTTETTDTSIVTTTVTDEGVTVDEFCTVHEIDMMICCDDHPYPVCEYCQMGE